MRKLKKGYGYHYAIGKGVTECEACGAKISKYNREGLCRQCQYDINHADDRW